MGRDNVENKFSRLLDAFFINCFLFNCLYGIFSVFALHHEWSHNIWIYAFDYMLLRLHSVMWMLRVLITVYEWNFVRCLGVYDLANVSFNSTLFFISLTCMYKSWYYPAVNNWSVFFVSARSSLSRNQMLLDNSC